MDFLKNADKNKVQKITLIVVAALTLLALVLLLVIIMASLDNSLGNQGEIGAIDSLEFESTPMTSEQLATGSLVLADSAHPYLPQEKWLGLVKIGEYMRAQSDYVAENDKDYENMNYVPWKVMRISDIAMPHVHQMLTDAKKAVGQKPITIDAAYDTIMHGNIYPEYATALSILLSDFTSGSETRVPLSNEYRNWLDKNAAKYGFIESFEDVYRYVGKVHAKYMTEKDLSLSEYIEYLKQNTSHEKLLKIKDSDGTSYGVYYASCLAGGSVQAPVITYDDNGNAEVSYEISGTNEGGVIITVKLN